MSNYKSYLLKFGDTEFPNNSFAEYLSTPDQRMDNDAERDDNGGLQRSTLPTGKTSITFSTHILHLNEKINMQNIINSAIVNTVQRKCYVTYWNDETTSDDSGYFYIPDIEFSVMDASKTDIL